MPTPRRSSRIRAGSATSRKSAGFTSSRLAAVTENDVAISSEPSDNAELQSPVPKTPTTSKLKPVHEEMHPSKAQQSTAKQPDSGLKFGFADVSTIAEQHTPSKTPMSSAFEFRFARPGPPLSADGQRMLDDLKEEAMRVKAILIAERDEAAKKAQENGELSGVGGRKIAQAKGKVGRFSDVHMAEFRKMDSIADHPSSFRAQPARVETVLKPAMKRSQSQAKLAEREEIVKEQARCPVVSESLENDAPAKRVRKAITDDASSTRPSSRSGIPSTPRHLNSTLSALTTPTQSSLARASNNKPTSQIPALSKSSSKSSLVAPSKLPQVPGTQTSTPRQDPNTTPQRTPQSALPKFAAAPRSEPRPFIRSPGKIDRLRSMLRYPSASARKPSSHKALVPPTQLSLAQPEFNKQLPALPSTPRGQDASKATKHVTFTPEVVNKHSTSIPPSPSPIKSGIPRSTSKTNLFSKMISPKPVIFHGSKSDKVEYPSLAGHPSLEDSNETAIVTKSSIRPLPALPRPVAKPVNPSTYIPSTFTFRSDHTIDCGKSPEGFGASPGQASVRQVRPSIFPEMPGAFPTANKENTAPIPCVPHGLLNKKRHRADSEDLGREDLDERSSKKLKTGYTSLKAPVVDAQKATPTSSTPSPVKKKGLSLSRLNMLARPKQRK